MKKRFRGVYTAIVTPFLENGEIDWPAFENLVERQVSAGITGIVPCGTTGESPTLSLEEQNELIKKTVSIVNKRCQVIAGTGSNCTKSSVAKSKFAEELGVDACMVVNPYYNKPTQEGLYLHFKEIANSVAVPIILYNIKGRTGVNLETKTLLRLVDECSNICAVKEASGDLDQMSEVIKSTSDDFAVLSGDDDLTLELISRGGDGVISVASNLIPDRMLAMVNKAFAGDMDGAVADSKSLKTLFEVEFIETNPIPIKAALAMKNLCKE
ncbi:MAG: 4-hydroxy-tetrahydrodipicolinate synthase, partial [Bdellovibrionales bacterium]|nr:4-hydroxy-tetrahydrodipicolinate synthase [Bdellovibrionales bacterium]